MAEENMSHVKEMNTDQNCCLGDEKSMEIIEETMPLIDEEIPKDDVLLLPSNGIKPVNVNLRRYSTGVLQGPGKAQVQTRYRGNQTSSTHDLCKHGKRREDDLVIKPWKLVTKKNVESGDLGKVETSGVMRRKSLGNVSNPEKSLREAAGSEIVKSCDGLRVKRSETKSTTTQSDSAVKKTSLDVNKKVSRISENTSSSKEDLLKNLKNKEKTTKIDEPVRCEDAMEKRVSRITKNKSSPKEDLLKNMKNKEKKTEIDEPVRCEDVSEKKVSRISENKSYPKEEILKNKEKTMKIDEPVKCEDVSEKTLYVVDSSIEEEKKNKKSIKGVKSEIKQPYEKKILRGSGKKSLELLPSLSPSSEKVKEPGVTRADPRPIRQTISRSKVGLSEKKETGSANLVTNPKTESKIRPKRIVLKVAPPLPKPAMQLSFKKGKVLDPKLEDSTSTLIKFKKRVVQEPKLRPDPNKKKKNLKEKREAIVKVNGEVKREKVVLRHRKVEAKKKLQTLFNNVIEETVSKLEEVRKSKVKALVGAFETVISLQDDNTKSSHKKNIQSKSTSSQVVEG